MPELSEMGYPANSLHLMGEVDKVEVDHRPNMVKLYAEANTIINGQRRKDYGPVNASLKSLVDHWNAYLQNQFPESGIILDEMNIIEMNILMKISRAVTGSNLNKKGKLRKRKRDTYRDIVGYAGLAELIDGLEDDDVPVQ